MPDPFAYLGLAADADERAIKRAYAQRLRSTRPDTDAAGFQSLNEAYRAALERAQRHDRTRTELPGSSMRVQTPSMHPVATTDSIDDVSANTDMDPFTTEPDLHFVWQTGDAGVPEIQFTIPAAAPVEVEWNPAPADITAQALRPLRAVGSISSRDEAFDFAAFFDALNAHAFAGDIEALRDWLQSQPALWSLAAKAQVGQMTMTALYAHAAPMPDRCLDSVLAFFDLDHVLAGQNPLRLRALRLRLHMEWLLQCDHRDLANHLRNAKPAVSLDVERIFALLSRPRRWLDTAVRVLPPNQPSEVANFLRHLEACKIEQWPPRFDREQIAFWRRAGDRSRLSWPRVAVGMPRCLTLLVVAVAIDGVLALLDESFPRLLLTRLAFGGVLLWGICLGWIALSNWQARAQDYEHGLGAWCRLAFIPLICIGVCVLRPLSTKDADGRPIAATIAISIALVGIAVVLAIVRYRRRAQSAPIQWKGNGLWRILFIVPALKALAAVGALFEYYAQAGALIAMAIWTADLWKQRAHLSALLRRR